ncbi:MAG: YdeI/OmpD-associated family protein [Chloroflexi bacterium]|nr:YdeI/OmpD-associated family protein [Chloroflexota bacterium]
MRQTFTSTVQQTGSRVFIPLPFDPQTTWGVKQRHHIRGTVNGIKVRGSLGSDGEQYFLLLGAAWRRDCDINVGSIVQVILEPEGPQQATLAPDITEALAAEPSAAEFFSALATFYRKNYVRWIEGAKRPETRAARIAELVTLLKAGKKER